MCNEGEAKTITKNELHHKDRKFVNSQEGDQPHDEDEKRTKVA